MNIKQKLMACTALLGVLLFHPATARAQSAEAQKIERLERQTELLQRQLPPPPPERVKVTLGGFIAAESVWRQRNQVNDIGTAFGAIPYPFSPLYNEHEFHGTARQSRISLLVEGNIDPYQKLSGYYESDFLGVGQTSNYNQSKLGSAPATRLFHL